MEPLFTSGLSHYCLPFPFLILLSPFSLSRHTHLVSQSAHSSSVFVHHHPALFLRLISSCLTLLSAAALRILTLNLISLYSGHLLYPHHFALLSLNFLLPRLLPSSFPIPPVHPVRTPPLPTLRSSCSAVSAVLLAFD